MRLAVLAFIFAVMPVALVVSGLAALAVVVLLVPGKTNPDPDAELVALLRTLARQSGACAKASATR